MEDNTELVKGINATNAKLVATECLLASCRKDNARLMKDNTVLVETINDIMSAQLDTKGQRAGFRRVC